MFAYVNRGVDLLDLVDLVLLFGSKKDVVIKELKTDGMVLPLNLPVKMQSLRPRCRIFHAEKTFRRAVGIQFTVVCHLELGSNPDFIMYVKFPNDKKKKFISLPFTVTFTSGKCTKDISLYESPVATASIALYEILRDAQIKQVSKQNKINHLT